MREETADTFGTESSGALAQTFQRKRDRSWRSNSNVDSVAYLSAGRVA